MIVCQENESHRQLEKKKQQERKQKGVSANTSESNTVATFHLFYRFLWSGVDSGSAWRERQGTQNCSERTEPRFFALREVDGPITSLHVAEALKNSLNEDSYTFYCQ